MTWVLTRNEDGAYVAPPGSPNSYTQNILKARLYRSRDEAQHDACGNETPKPLLGEFTNA